MFTDVSEEYTASIFVVEEAGLLFFHGACLAYSLALQI
jgi:hypothetical protein